VTTPDRWREASSRLLAKAIGEWCYEGMLTPVPEDERYRLDLGAVSYTFTATGHAFGWLRVDPISVQRHSAGLLGNRTGEPATDPLRFLVDAAPAMGVDPVTLAGYASELSATLAADVRCDPGDVTRLRALDHAELESWLTGHPWIVANKGRIGFSETDSARYAPESRRRLRLPWLAVHRGLAEFRGTPDLSEHAVRQRELPPETVDRFENRLATAGLDPDGYVWLPVHPWQLDHAVRVWYSGELAARRIVVLGTGPDRYLPQQSIRTLTNMSARRRYDVKLPLSIMNTSVWRGIPPHCSLGAPVLAQWLRGLLGTDPILADTVFLGEVASVTVRRPYLDGVDGVPYRHLEALGCIWREPVAAQRRPGERVRSLSALLHVDGHGRALLASLVAASGRPATDWLRALFATLLTPLLYVLYRYGLTFNPHGQNASLSYGPDEMPRRLFLKDFVDDIELSTGPVPERAPEPDGILPRKPPALIAQHVVDSLLIGHFRYLAPLAAEHLGVPEPHFWSLVRDAVLAVQQRFPDLSHRFAEYDLLAPEFPRYRLNADRLLVTGYGDAAIRHAIGAAGTVLNPLAGRDPGAAMPPVPDGGAEGGTGQQRGGRHGGPPPQGRQ
jgi:siderophore synthetase component